MNWMQNFANRLNISFIFLSSYFLLLCILYSMTTVQGEKIYQSIWHTLIVIVGLYELKTHKSLASKILSCGLIVFHLDGILADATDTKTYSRRLLERLIK